MKDGLFLALSFPFFMLCLTLLQLSVLWLHVCLFGLGVCPHVHLYPRLCLHTASCLALYLCPLCPTLYCNMLSFSPLIVLPLREARESGAGARRKSLSLVALKGKQTVRCTNTGSAAFLTRAPAGRLSLCSVYQKAAT